MRPAKWSRCSSRPRAESPPSDARTLKALIVAAGLGTRLRDIAPSKPLAAVHGKPLIQSVIQTAAQAGVGGFVVVTGYQAPALEDFLKRLAKRAALDIETVHNPEWTRSNGLSVVAADALLDDDFVLLMADHLFEPGLLGGLLCEPRIPGGVTLAVDRQLDNPLVDLDDVTRVLTDGAGRILEIGKGLKRYDAFDTGIFLATKGLMAGIRGDLAAGGQGSISGGMNRLARHGLARVFDVGEQFWLDVDDAAAWEHAERLTA
jgi:1L-myo-inositol 1-phosphate cytidylyltransferase